MKYVLLGFVAKISWVESRVEIIITGGNYAAYIAWTGFQVTQASPEAYIIISDGRDSRSRFPSREISRVF